MVVLNGRYILGRRLGSGAFGSAYLVTDKSDNSQKVAKQIVVVNFAQAAFQLIFMGNMNNVLQKINECNQEASFLRNLNHPNIIRFSDSFSLSTSSMAYFYIITEFCEGGNLENRLNNNKLNNILLGEQKVLTWFRQLTNALHYLHALNIIHRDIKPQNVFIKNEVLKLGDFGLATFQSFFGNQVAGTTIYLSPECFTSNTYTRKTDSWSLGCVFYEICTYERMFNNEYEILNKYLYFGDIEYSARVKNIIAGLLDRNYINRLGTSQVLSYLNPPVIQRTPTMVITPRTPLLSSRQRSFVQITPIPPVINRQNSAMNLNQQPAFVFLPPIYRPFPF